MLSFSKSRGFTLIEILIVIAIIAALTAIALPALRGAAQRAAAARARAELAFLTQALENYRRLYGDYPQTGEFAQASPDTAQPLATAHAQAKFFNALSGVFGPRAFAAEDRLDGFPFIDAAKFTLEFSPTGIFQAAGSARPQKEEVCTALLDPWGRRYLYYYKSADDPSVWKATGYRLYSAGLDGMQAPPDAASGIDPTDAPATRVNADNISADALTR